MLIPTNADSTIHQGTNFKGVIYIYAAGNWKNLHWQS